MSWSNGARIDGDGAQWIVRDGEPGAVRVDDADVRAGAAQLEPIYRAAVQWVTVPSWPTADLDGPTVRRWPLSEHTMRGQLW